MSAEPTPKNRDDTTTSPCRECGDAVEHHVKRDSENAICDDCYTTESIERLKDVVRNPRDNEQFSRPDAVRRLIEDFDREILPIEDHDGTTIVSANVEYGSGRGGAPNGWYFDSITKVVERDCPNCPHDRANKVYRTVSAGQSLSTYECRACDETIEHHGP